jgi:hypothetical protein
MSQKHFPDIHCGTQALFAVESTVTTYAEYRIMIQAAAACYTDI